jgi:hypothetical protein
VIRRLVAAALAACFVLGVAQRARAAEPSHRIRWDERWERFRPIEYGMLTTIFVELLLVETQLAPPREARWRGGVLFDDALRSALVAESVDGRTTAAEVSDALTLAAQVYPLAFDSALFPLAFDRWNFDVAWQMTMMNAQALGLNGLAMRFGHRVIGRERPDAAACRDDPEWGNCKRGGKLASFPGGHAGSAFATAGLSCAHHAHLDLFGHPVADAAACGGMLGLATTVGVLRIVADRHYVSDVLAGAAIGFLNGWGMPRLLHYRPLLGGGDRRAIRWAAAPWADADRLGATVLGLF